MIANCGFTECAYLEALTTLWIQRHRNVVLNFIARVMNIITCFLRTACRVSCFQTSVAFVQHFCVCYLSDDRANLTLSLKN